MAAETKKSRKKSKSQTAETTPQSSGAGGFLSGIVTYFREVRTELNKVSWPDRPDVISLLRIVLAVTVLSSLALGIVSLGFQQLVAFGIDNWWVVVLLFGAIVGGAVYLLRQGDRKSGY